MMLPSITNLLLGVTVIAVLAIVDWYVSRTTSIVLYPLSPIRTPDTNKEDDVGDFKRVA